MLLNWFEKNDILLIIDYQYISSDEYEYTYTIKYEENNGEKRECNRRKEINSLNHWGSGYSNDIRPNTKQQARHFGILKCFELMKGE
jgi:hypothetical protein